VKRLIGMIRRKIRLEFLWDLESAGELTPPEKAELDRDFYGLETSITNGAR
jgi:hypothetical protein